MQKVSQKIVALGAGAVALGTNAMAAGNIVLPTVDYTDFYAGVGLSLGVALTVMLARKVKGFISK